MAVDKLVDSAQLESDLTDIADAIRAKTGKSTSMEFPGEFVSEIGSISGGGGAFYSGIFTPTERQASYNFYAPNCTYIAIIATSTPDTSTGLAFIYACVGYVDRLYASQSTNSGTSIAGGNDTGKVKYQNDTFTITFGNDNKSKTPQVGLTYAWCAW